MHPVGLGLDRVTDPEHDVVLVEDGRAEPLELPVPGPFRGIIRAGGDRGGGYI